MLASFPDAIASYLVYRLMTNENDELEPDVAARASRAGEGCPRGAGVMDRADFPLIAEGFRRLLGGDRRRRAPVRPPLACACAPDRRPRPPGLAAPRRRFEWADRFTGRPPRARRPICQARARPDASAGVNGSCRIRFPVALKIAFEIAAGMFVISTSPAPDGRLIGATDHLEVELRHVYEPDHRIRDPVSGE